MSFGNNLWRVKGVARLAGNCKRAQNLLGIYTRALAEFQHAQAPIVDGMLPQHPEYETVRKNKDLAFSAVLLARRQYWSHAEEHGCRDTTQRAV